jgi:hypothetical protein
MVDYDLEAAAAHAWYEFAMIEFAWQRLSEVLRPTDHSDARKEQLIYLEAFLLHYRVVLDFLSPRGRPWSSDILASHFLGSEIDLKAPIEHRTYIDKNLAHLTTARLRSEPLTWPVPEMVLSMRKCWLRFLSELEASTHPERRAWFEHPAVRG